MLIIDEIEDKKDKKIKNMGFNKRRRLVRVMFLNGVEERVVGVVMECDLKELKVERDNKRGEWKKID